MEIILKPTCYSVPISTGCNNSGVRVEAVMSGGDWVNGVNAPCHLQQ